MARSRLLLLAALLGVPSYTSAQEWEVHRRSFPFLENRLTVEVAGEVPGTLRLARAGLGRLEVAARASAGIASFGLAGPASDRLVLSAVGAEQVEYLVLVPEAVRVRVLLPGRRVAEPFRPRGGSVEFRWGEARRPPAAAATMPAAADASAPKGGVGAAGGLKAYEAPSAPRVVRVAESAGARSVRVSLGSGPFRLSADHPLVLDTSSPDTLVVVRPRAAAITLLVPADAAGFRLHLDAQEVLRIEGDEFRSGCRPRIEQRSGDGASVTFAPLDTPLDCRAESPGTPTHPDRRSRSPEPETE